MSYEINDDNSISLSHVSMLTKNPQFAMLHFRMGDGSVVVKHFATMALMRGEYTILLPQIGVSA